MNDSVCQLEDFHLTALSVQWNDPKKTGTYTVTNELDYDVGQHQTEKERYRLTLRFMTGPEKPEPVGYSVAAEIVGFFRFPERTEQSKMDYLVRVNGCTILYGILRGQIANVTGTFPHKKFILPTIMMRDVVLDLEKAKAEEAKKAKPGKKKPLKA